MTNKEYIASLNDEELAKWIANIIYDTSNKKCCNYAYCDTVEDERGEFSCDWNCVEGIRKWLCAEHKGENHDE